MSDVRTRVVDWLRNEFAEEQRAGFVHLLRVPDTQVVRFLDHFAGLAPRQIRPDDNPCGVVFLRAFG